MTWQSFIQYCNLQYVFSAIISFILFLYNSIKTASLETVFIPYHLIYLYNNNYLKNVNYFILRHRRCCRHTAWATFTKLSLRAFPMRSNRILITRGFNPLRASLWNVNTMGWSHIVLRKAPILIWINSVVLFLRNDFSLFNLYII